MVTFWVTNTLLNQLDLMQPQFNIFISVAHVLELTLLQYSSENVSEVGYASLKTFACIILFFSEPVFRLF